MSLLFSDNSRHFDSSNLDFSEFRQKRTPASIMGLLKSLRFNSLWKSSASFLQYSDNLPAH
jgi:hypothetical protein